MGPLPATGQWQCCWRCRQHSSSDWRASTLNGMAYTLYNGRATWDYAGKE